MSYRGPPLYIKEVSASVKLATPSESPGILDGSTALGAHSRTAEAEFLYSPPSYFYVC